VWHFGIRHVLFIYGNGLVFCLRCCKEDRDHIQNIYIAPRGIVESRCVDKNNATPVQNERIPRLYDLRAGFQLAPNTEV
jgi:hypothetical protein